MHHSLSDQFTGMAVAVQAQEGLEELSHVEGQEGAAVRKYPSSKVRSSGCALLEQL